MSTLDDLLNMIPVGDIAQKLGVEESVAKLAVQTAVPALIGGMTHNAQTEAGAASLESALKQHADAPAELSLDAIDPKEGEKIVGHVFGDKEKDVVAALGAQAAPIAGLLPKLLPLLAPIVMSFLANKALSGAKAAPEAASGGGIGDLLGGLLGGGQQQNAGGGIGDLLGGLLGGGQQQSSGGGLGGLLGGLLGGKK